MVAHEGERIVKGVRYDRDEDVPRGQQEIVEEQAAQGGVEEVRPRRSVQRLLVEIRHDKTRCGSVLVRVSFSREGWGAGCVQSGETICCGHIRFYTEQHAR